ncbi:MAG: DUF1569 domain-containing protein [Terracidiphilus sp.]
MRNLYQPSDSQGIIDRLALLKPDSPRQWGSMSPSQAVAHCATSMEWAVGDRLPPRMFFASILGRIIKPKVLGDDAPFRRNSPTSKDLIVHGQPDLAAERERLTRLINRFVAAGPAGCTTNPHSFFGRLTPNEWAILTCKHLDHHLRQFGV